mgnify:FL=1
MYPMLKIRAVTPIRKYIDSSVRIICNRFSLLRMTSPVNSRTIRIMYVVVFGWSKVHTLVLVVHDLA